jgi:hypothetical protein
VAGDGPLTEEELRGNLPIRPAGGDQDGDAPLGRRQSFFAHAPADPSQLGTRLLDPRGCSELLEAAERGVDRLSGRALPPCAPEDYSEREQGATASERIADFVVLRRCLLERRDCLIDSTPRRSDEPAAARHVGEHPLPGEPRRIRFPEVDDSHRIIDPAELEQRLRVVGGPRPRVRRTPAECRRLPVGLAEAFGSRRRVSTPERDESRDGLEQGRMESDLLLTELQGSRRLLLRKLE